MLKSRAHELQTAMAAALTVMRLPTSLQSRVQLFNQYIELQYDRSALEVLYSLSSQPLRHEIRIYQYAPLLENAEFFQKLTARGVGEIFRKKSKRK